MEVRSSTNDAASSILFSIEKRSFYPKLPLRVCLASGSLLLADILPGYLWLFSDQKRLLDVAFATCPESYWSLLGTSNDSTWQVRRIICAVYEVLLTSR